MNQLRNVLISCLLLICVSDAQAHWHVRDFYSLKARKPDFYAQFYEVYFKGIADGFYKAGALRSGKYCTPSHLPYPKELFRHIEKDLGTLKDNLPKDTFYNMPLVDIVIQSIKEKYACPHI